MVYVAGGQSANGTSTTVPGLQYGQTYFFKITGPDALVTREKTAFLDFLKTVRAP